MKRLFTTLAIALASSSLSQAQEPTEPPSKLEAFREAFEKAMEARSGPARETFANGLEQLARQRAQDGDYESAIRARDRRLELLGNLPSTTASPASQEREIVIDLAAGKRTGGGLKYDTRGKKITGFSKSNQDITWELSKTEPGIYSALVTYSCGDPIDDGEGNITKTGGVFTLAEAISISTTASEPLRRTVVATGGWNKTVTRKIGKITVTGTSTSLRLAVTKAEAGGLMHLYGIRLVPVISTATDEEAGTISAELISLREKFRSAISAQTTPIIMSYGMALRTLREKLTNADQLEAAFEVQKEYNAAEKLAKDPALILEAEQAP